MENVPRFIYRKPTRLKKYDYSRNNYYFITICTNNKQCIFGTIQKLSKMGKIAEQEFLQLEAHYTNVHLDQFVVMPNHVHAIISIDGEKTGAGKTTLNSIVGSYKAGVSRRIRVFSPDTCVWQRSFHDHIIRGQEDYEKIWTYIEYNAQKCEQDCFYPKDTNF